ncbi:hypothetical protein [uncultured Desulfosarcina sp.]|uniref:hypothetical protein n=1 Tax=uncultured Desulfosarcina sp. TaxID=218289 RepID=UPI0029C6E0DB|nr:hypothetical protein [uncultured Desulfosarcina sp.]
MDNSRFTHYPTGITPPRPATTTSSALAMGGVGMIVGGSASAAANIRRLNSGEIEKSEAVKNVIRDSAGAGIATAAATAVVGALRLGGLLSVVGLLTTATATKYLYDTAFEPKPAPATVKPETKKAPAAKKVAKPANRTKPKAKAKAKPASKAKPAAEKEV